jgi:hypothetical protein
MRAESFSALIFLLTLASSVNAQAAVFPALGVKGSPTSRDVQHLSIPNPCGDVDIALNIDNSTALLADQSGYFSPSVVNFKL